MKHSVFRRMAAMILLSALLLSACPAALSADLTAVRNAASCTVTFSVPEGVTQEPMSAAPGASITLPTPSGTPNNGENSAEFVGWIESSVAHQTSVGTYYEAGKEYSVTADVTLYALYRYSVAGGAPKPFAVGASGDFVLAANVNGTYFAIPKSLEITSKKINAKSIEVTNGFVTDAEASSYVLTLTRDGACNYTIFNGSKYLKYASSTNLEQSGTSYNWLITTGTNGSWRVTASSTVGEGTVRALIFLKDSKSTKFGAYSTAKITESPTQYYDLEILPVSSASTTYYTTVFEAAESHLDKALDFYKVTLSLGNDLGADFIIDTGAEQNSGYSDFKVIFEYTKDGKDYTETVTTELVQEDSRYRYARHTVAAKEMTDEIKATIQATKDGVTYQGETKTWSVRDAIMKSLANANKEPNEKTKATYALYVAILNYGAAAQTYFDYKLDDLANSQLTEAQAAYLDMSKVAISDTVSEGTAVGVTFEAPALELERSIWVDLIVKLGDYTPDQVECRIEYKDWKGKQQAATYTGTKQIQKVESGDYAGCYLVVFDKLIPTQMRETFTVAFYKAGTEEPVSETLTYSIQSFIFKNQSDEKLTPLLNALLAYGVAAEAYSLVA